jgi:hypothetical protein
MWSLASKEGRSPTITSVEEESSRKASEVKKDVISLALHNKNLCDLYSSQKLRTIAKVGEGGIMMDLTSSSEG